MPSNCAVPGCYSNIKKTKLYLAPYTNKKRWLAWCQFCPFLKKLTLMQLANARFCGKHFLPGHINEKDRLTPDAIPTLMLPSLPVTLIEPEEAKSNVLAAEQVIKHLNGENGTGLDSSIQISKENRENVVESLKYEHTYSQMSRGVNPPVVDRYLGRLWVGNRCVLCGRRKTKDNENEVILSRFPMQPKVCKAWVKYVGLEELVQLSVRTLHNSVFLCNDHFYPYCYEYGRLKLYSIPDRNLPYPPLPPSLLEDFYNNADTEYDQKQILLELANLPMLKELVKMNPTVKESPNKQFDVEKTRSNCIKKEKEIMEIIKRTASSSDGPVEKSYAPVKKRVPRIKKRHTPIKEPDGSIQELDIPVQEQDIHFSKLDVTPQEPVIPIQEPDASLQKSCGLIEKHESHDNLKAEFTSFFKGIEDDTRIEETVEDLIDLDFDEQITEETDNGSIPDDYEDVEIKEEVIDEEIESEPGEEEEEEAGMTMVDEIDSLFFSYSHTFKKLSCFLQAPLLMDIAKLFARYEIKNEAYIAKNRKKRKKRKKEAEKMSMFPKRHCSSNSNFDSIKNQIKDDTALGSTAEVFPPQSGSMLTKSQVVKKETYQSADGFPTSEFDSSEMRIEVKPLSFSTVDSSPIPNVRLTKEKIKHNSSTSSPHVALPILDKNLSTNNAQDGFVYLPEKVLPFGASNTIGTQNNREQSLSIVSLAQPQIPLVQPNVKYSAAQSHQQIALSQPQIGLTQPQISLAQPKISQDQPKMQQKVALAKPLITLAQPKTGNSKPKIAKSANSPPVQLQIVLAQPQIAVAKPNTSLAQSNIALTKSTDALAQHQIALAKQPQILGQPKTTPVGRKTISSQTGTALTQPQTVSSRTRNGLTKVFPPIPVINLIKKRKNMKRKSTTDQAQALPQSRKHPKPVKQKHRIPDPKELCTTSVEVQMELRPESETPKSFTPNIAKEDSRQPSSVVHYPFFSTSKRELIIHPLPSRNASSKENVGGADFDVVSDEAVPSPSKIPKLGVVGSSSPYKISQLDDVEFPSPSKFLNLDDAGVSSTEIPSPDVVGDEVDSLADADMNVSSVEFLDDSMLESFVVDELDLVEEVEIQDYAS